MVLSTNKMGGLISTHLNKGGKMKYLILQDTVANKEKVKAGDIVELPIDEGRSLVMDYVIEKYGSIADMPNAVKKELLV